MDVIIYWWTYPWTTGEQVLLSIGVVAAALGIWFFLRQLRRLRRGEPPAERRAEPQQRRDWGAEFQARVLSRWFPMYKTEAQVARERLVREAKAFEKIMIDKLHRLGLSHTKRRGRQHQVDRIKFYRCIVHHPTQTLHYQVDEPYPTGIRVKGLIDPTTVKALENAAHREVTVEHCLKTGVWFVIGEEYKRQRRTKLAYLPPRVAYGEIEVKAAQSAPIGRGYRRVSEPQRKLTDYVHDFRTSPHLLIAGATGTGKSNVVNVIICSLYEMTPDVTFRMIDLKRVELSFYRRAPHTEVVVEPAEVMRALYKVRSAISDRLELMETRQVRHICDLSAADRKEYPPLYLVIDELAEVTLDPEIDKGARSLLIRIAQLGRAADVHVVLATQRPSVDVVDGSIKANFPTRLALTMASQVDSKTILDRAGAEKLTPPGHALYKRGAYLYEVRVPLITAKQVAEVIAALNTSELTEFELRECQVGLDVFGGALPQRAMEEYFKGEVSQQQVRRGLQSIERKGFAMPGTPNKPRQVIRERVEPLLSELPAS